MVVTLAVTSDFDLTTPYADALAGGGTGIDLLQAQNGSFSPLVDKSLNQGEKLVYLSHDGNSEITSVKTFVQIYGTDTGFTYGGSDTAGNDYTRLLALGAASGDSKNNADNLSGGFWMDHNQAGNDTTRFDRANDPTNVKIYGKDDSGQDGSNLSAAFDLQTAALQYDSGGGTPAAATSPELGKIGPSGNTVLGDRARLAQRFYLPLAETEGGIMQWEWVIAYSYTD
jgi:hypothetical protein